ncbi:MAG: ABC transporter substrate-binding protein [Rhodobacteraceae bacterium]|nr:ABC transporter substrate-binding protein [Paracoccaceae bacterium]
MAFPNETRNWRNLPFGVLLLGLLLILSVGFGLLTLWRSLLPPQDIRMAAGIEGGAYEAIAMQYKTILARDRLRLTVVPTAGSAENMELLVAGEVDVALIQGGIRAPEEAGVSALAAVFLEPFFVLHRGAPNGTPDATLWDGLRIAAGAPGSGTRAALDEVLRELNIDIDDSRFLPIGGAEAAAALETERVDVAVFVAPVTAPYLQNLLRDPTVQVESLRDSRALSRQFDYVRLVDIPAAGIDYTNRVPPEPVSLTAMVASLAAQNDLHPALVNRFVRAAQRIHSGPVLLSDDIRFPTTQGVDLPMNNQAAEALTDGPSVFEKYLPYWMAAQIRSVLLILVPLLLVTFPILRALPMLFVWQMNTRVFKHYRELLQIERRMADGNLSDEDRADCLERLAEIDAKVAKLNLPLRFREKAYALRLHMDIVRDRLNQNG